MPQPTPFVSIGHDSSCHCVRPQPEWPQSQEISTSSGPAASQYWLQYFPSASTMQLHGGWAHFSIVWVMDHFPRAGGALIPCTINAISLNFVSGRKIVTEGRCKGIRFPLLSDTASTDPRWRRTVTSRFRSP